MTCHSKGYTRQNLEGYKIKSYKIKSNKMIEVELEENIVLFINCIQNEGNKFFNWSQKEIKKKYFHVHKFLKWMRKFVKIKESNSLN